MDTWILVSVVWSSMAVVISLTALRRCTYIFSKLIDFKEEIRGRFEVR